MKEIINKLSSYNLFNYLLPGTVFVALTEAFTSFPFAQDDLLIALFLYYFIGLIISRIGSLFVEPFLRWDAIYSVRGLRGLCKGIKIGFND